MEGMEAVCMNGASSRETTGSTRTGRCQRICVWFSNAPPWQEQMTEKKLLVERYVLQTNTNTDGRVESRDTGQ